MWGGAELQARPWGDDENPFTDMENGDAVEDIYDTNAPYILANHYEAPAEMRDNYNFPINETITDNDIDEQMRYIFGRQRHSYKLNMSAGVILDDGQGNLRYFIAYLNMLLLNRAEYVRDARTLRRSINRLQNMDLNEMIRNFKPASAASVVFICNLEYYVYPLHKYNLAERAPALPDYIAAENRSIISEWPADITSGLCVFVALALHYNDREHMRRNGRQAAPLDHPARLCRRKLKELFYIWIEYCLQENVHKYSKSTFADYRGVDLDDLYLVEKCFEIRINVHHLNPDKSSYTVYCSTMEYEDTVHFNVYENHVNYIRNISMYSPKFVCNICERMFTTVANMVRHRRNCTRKSRHVFKTGFHAKFRTVFDQLEYYGVRVPRGSRYFKHIVCWDLESVLKPLSNTSSEGRKLMYSTEHVPVSCSICSNVPGFKEPHTIVTPVTSDLVAEMFEHFNKIRDKQNDLAKAKWGQYYDALLGKITDRIKLNLDLYELGNLDCGFRSFLRQDIYYTQMCILLRKFRRYINQCVLLGFNSSSYDLNAIRSEIIQTMCDMDKDNSHDNLVFDERDDLFGEMGAGDGDGDDDDDDDDDRIDDDSDDGEDDDCIEEPGREGGDKESNKKSPREEAFSIINDLKLTQPPGRPSMIKRVNKYLSLSNNHFSFIDLMSYLGPGTSYSKFLASFNIKEEKFFFPYSHLTSFERLNDPLPEYPGESWYSDIKSCDLLNAAHDEWSRAGKQGPAPKTGEENYQYIKEVWNEKGFKSLKCMLRYYNALDVKPMVDACAQLMKQFHALDLDFLKNSISLPGLSRLLMHRHAEANECIFPYIADSDKDLAYMIKANLAAGPSIIGVRHQRKGVTPIDHGSEEICQKIVGLDCSAMYAWCMAQEMPAYAYCRRYKHDKFIPHYTPTPSLMYVWLQAEEKSRNLRILTNMTLAGNEVQIGRYRVDGFAIDQNDKPIVFEFLGCHFHRCKLCKAGKRNKYKDAYEKTISKIKELESLGYRVVTEWECLFRKRMRKNPELKQMADKFKPEFLARHPRGPVKESTILEAIRNDKIFGFALCDVTTPGDLYDKFKKFPPIFINHKVAFDDVGEHMQDFIRKNNINFNQPRRLLVSGMRAESVLLSTKLLQYYMKLGIVVSNVRQVVEFCRARPYAKLVQTGADKRRQQSLDPDKKILGDMYKLLLNACYGSSLTNKLTHTKVRIVRGEQKARLAANHKNFKALRHMSQSYYEVEHAPDKIVHDTLTMVGFTILNYAKIKLLEIVYDWMDIYVHPKHWNVALCDTDSAYFTISKPSIEEAVRPEMKARYEKEHKGRCGDANYDGIVVRECCAACKLYDSKTPGIYKAEWEGDVLVALASKTYCGSDMAGENVKLSAKGCNKNAMLRNGPMTCFSNVLQSGESHVCRNAGFRMHNGRMCSYFQSKISASYVYVKRQVLTGGVYTVPLTVCLNPAPVEFLCMQSDLKCLAPDYPAPFVFESENAGKVRFMTIYQAYIYMLAAANRAQSSVLSDIMLTYDFRELWKLYRGVKTVSVQWEEEDRDIVLEQIISQRFHSVQFFERGKCLLRRKRDLPIMNNTLCSMTGTGLSPECARWQRDYNSWGRNYIGLTYSRLREIYRQ